MTRRTRIRKIVTAGVVPLGLVAGTAVVQHDSFAAFSATTSTPTGTFTAGGVALTTDAVSAPFATGVLVPGAPADRRCVVLTYAGTVPADVSFSVTGYAAGNGAETSGNLEDTLELTVERVSGTPACSGTWSGATPLFTGTPKAFGQAVPTAAYTVSGVAPNTQQTYRITYALPALPAVGSVGGNNGAMNDTVAFALTWAAQNA
jgi:hypothetical protein